MPHPKQCQFLGETRGKEKVAGHRARTGESGTKVGLEDIGMKDAWNTEMLRIDPGDHRATSPCVYQALLLHEISNVPALYLVSYFSNAC